MLVAWHRRQSGVGRHDVGQPPCAPMAARP